ncbi:MAG: hypothetical protein ACTHWH_03790 [Marinobacter sp.]
MTALVPKASMTPNSRVRFITDITMILTMPAATTTHTAEMTMSERIVQAIESAAELPAYRERILSWAPKIARFDPGPVGAFMGYDFRNRNRINFWIAEHWF